MSIYYQDLFYWLTFSKKKICLKNSFTRNKIKLKFFQTHSALLMSYSYWKYIWYLTEYEYRWATASSMTAHSYEKWKNNFATYAHIYNPCGIFLSCICQYNQYTFSCVWHIFLSYPLTGRRGCLNKLALCCFSLQQSMFP